MEKQHTNPATLETIKDWMDDNFQMTFSTKYNERTVGCNGKSQMRFMFAGPLNNNSALIQVMAQRPTADDIIACTNADLFLFAMWCP